MPVPPTGVPKPRKPRPSRARGLRTTTGCLTCRKRRVKCDESKPRCGPCTKSDRECVYAPPREPPLPPPPPPPSNATVNPADEPPVAAHDAPSEPTSGTPSVRASIEASASASASAPASTNVASPTNQRPMGDIDPQLFNNSPELHFDLSPLTIANSLPSPHGSGAPLDWYDLLAEDAINNIQKHNLGFDGTVLSRRQSPAAETPSVDTLLHSADQRLVEPPTHEPWNTPNIIPLADDELNLLRYYVNEVGPILDLFDPERHFATCVPRLAVHNVGLLKSLLAVAARHMALHSSRQSHPSGFNDRTPGSNVSGMADETGLINPLLQVATQYYYDTLRYLSQNLFYPAYSQSDEIIATAILISTYEMFDAEGSYSDGAWERHLRGIFWIQKFQGNNGESKDGLRRAAWWSWIRQDIWVAFREGRRVLTIFRPTKRLVDLTPDELATRILYLCARCVDYASTEKKTDMSIRIEQGDKLLHALDDWHRILPSSFQPVYRLPPSESGAFSPVWIHPPMYAAAMQTFHFARIIVIISQPSTGGMNIFRQRQRCLDDSVETICGIAMMHQGQDLSSAFMNFQAVYAAGLCVQTPAKQSAILQLLEKILDVGKFPPKTLLTDLANYWREGS